MRKTFKLHIEGKHPDRVMDAIKHDIKKYIRRERNKALPEGVDYWDFDCRFGLTQDDAAAVHANDFNKKLDEAASNGADSFYVEILAKPGVRGQRDIAPEAVDE